MNKIMLQILWAYLTGNCAWGMNDKYEITSIHLLKHKYVWIKKTYEEIDRRS